MSWQRAVQRLNADCDAIRLTFQPTTFTCTNLFTDLSQLINEKLRYCIKKKITSLGCKCMLTMYTMKSFLLWWQRQLASRVLGTIKLIRNFGKTRNWKLSRHLQLSQIIGERLLVSHDKNLFSKTSKIKIPISPLVEGSRETGEVRIHQCASRGFTLKRQWRFFGKPGDQCVHDTTVIVDKFFDYFHGC